MDMNPHGGNMLHLFKLYAYMSKKNTLLFFGIILLVTGIFSIFLE